VVTKKKGILRESIFIILSDISDCPIIYIMITNLYVQ